MRQTVILFGVHHIDAGQDYMMRVKCCDWVAMQQSAPLQDKNGTLKQQMRELKAIAATSAVNGSWRATPNR